MTDPSEEAAGRRRRRRRRASIGDIVELLLGTGEFAYCQYACASDHYEFVRVLPGRYPVPLSKDEAVRLAAGPEDYVTPCMLQMTIKGDGIEIVGCTTVPEQYRVAPPMRTVWWPEDPDLGIIKDSDGTIYTAAAYAALHPELDIEMLPESSIPFPGTFVSRLEEGWTPKELDERRRPADPRPRSQLVPELMSAQLALLALHQDRAEVVLVSWFAVATSGEALPFLRPETLKEKVRDTPPDTLVSVAICLAAGQSQHIHRMPQPPLSASPKEQLEWMSEGARPRLFREAVFGFLDRRKLPFTPDDFELLATLVGLAQDNESLKLVTAMARNFFVRAPADPTAIRGIQDLLARLTVVHADRRLTVDALRAVVAAQISDDDQEIHVIDELDAFGTPALQLVQQLGQRWNKTRALFAHLASARGSRPSAKWIHHLDEYRNDPEFSEAIQGILRLVLSVELTNEGFPEELLLSEGNAVVVRGAVWATPSASGGWRTEVLRLVALRCSAWKSTVSAPLCSNVALATVDALLLMGDKESQDQLEQLFHEVVNASLLRKIAGAINASDGKLSDELQRLRANRRTDIKRPWLGRWG